MTSKEKQQQKDGTLRTIALVTAGFLLATYFFTRKKA